MQTPSTMTIGKRLAFGFGLVLALMIALTGFGIQKVDFIERTLTEITDVNAVKQRYAINFRGSVHDRAISLRDVTLLESPADLVHCRDHVLGHQLLGIDIGRDCGYRVARRKQG